MKTKTIILASAIAVGALAAAQLKSGVLPEWTDSFSESADHAAVVTMLQEQKTDLQAQKRELDAQIAASYALSPRKTAGELLTLNARLGKSALSGSGISITLRPTADRALSQLIAVVNTLKISQADGIAVEGVRVNFTTSFLIDNGMLTIGAAQKPLGNTITIEAIGDQDALLSALANRNELSILRTATTMGEVSLTATPKSALTIPAL